MAKLKRVCWLLLLSLTWTGCASFTVTNITPSTMPRNPEGLYSVEMDLSSNQQTLRQNSLKPYVVLGFDFYEMQRTLNLPNRWETLIPVPADQNTLYYRFKVDYEYNEFGGRGQGSKMSTEYKMMIRD